MHPKMAHPSGSMLKWHRHRGANWMMPHNNELCDSLEVPPQLAEAEVHTDHEIQATSSAHPPTPSNRKPSPVNAEKFRLWQGNLSFLCICKKHSVHQILNTRVRGNKMMHFHGG